MLTAAFVYYQRLVNKSWEIIGWRNITQQEKDDMTMRAEAHA